MCAVVTLAGSGGLLAEQRLNHAAWDDLLQRHVRADQVDYQGVLAEEPQLVRYLDSLQAVDPDRLSGNGERMAFWINAYNASVVKGVLAHYPLRSVQDVKGFFDRWRYQVGGGSLTLNEMEARGRALGDWRIHFAVVCASSSCPPLRAGAYRGETLDNQLTEQTRRFLQDARRGLRIDGSTLWVSKIFDWYAEDFVLRKRLGLLKRLTSADLLTVITAYLEPDVAQRIEGPGLALRFIEYDWSLNNAAR